ncbi:hypothetical protein KA057_01225 [Candidatus Gracilibacteria bacterium]|nr:hypothetical protein [Candidatus Gracilibacteria bacterium]
MHFYPKFEENIPLLRTEVIMEKIFNSNKNVFFKLKLLYEKNIILSINSFRQVIGVRAVLVTLPEKTNINFEAHNISIIFPLIPISFSIYYSLVEYDIEILIGGFGLGCMFYFIQLMQYKMARYLLLKELRNISNNEEQINQI